MSNINGSHYAAYANGNLYVSANINNTPTLYALNALTGQQEWSLTGAGGIGNLVVTDNMLFASQGSNTVAISLTTHQVLWSVPITGTLAISDNELFIGSDNTVSAFAIAVPEPSSLLLLAIGGVGGAYSSAATASAAKTFDFARPPPPAHETTVRMLL